MKINAVLTFLLLSTSLSSQAMETLKPIYYKDKENWIGETQKRKNIKILFMGNPGAGKSSLLNSLAGEIKFKSGSNIGEGLTKHLENFEKDGVQYIDSPGLFDGNSENTPNNVTQIQNAFKEAGNFVIFFVIKEDDLRIKSDDFITMHVILNALKRVNDIYKSSDKLGDIPYSIIINQVIEHNINKFRKSENINKLVSMFEKFLPWAPHDICIFPCIDEARGRKNFMIRPHSSFVAWVHNQASVKLDHNNLSYVDNIEILNEEKREQLQNKIKDAQDKISKLAIEIEQTRAALKSANK